MRTWFWVLVRLVLLMGLLAQLRPPQILVTLGAPETVRTRNLIAGVHTRFTDEAEAWKIQRGLQMVREMGASWVVEFFPWAYSEPSAGVFDWGSADRVVNHANRQGLKIIARLGFVPLWARQHQPEPTTFTYVDDTVIAHFAKFAATFAAHFNDRVQHVVIWNEPNLSGEWGLRPVDPALYGRMLQAVYPSIKKANPNMRVLAGALAPTLEPASSPNGLNDLLYLEALLATLSHAPKAYDGWAVHSYGRQATADEMPAPDRINFRRTELLRDMLVKFGDGDLPMFITEAGWNDDPRWAFGVTPAQRIEYTLAAFGYAQTHWHTVQCVAMWVFKLPAPANNYRDHFTFVNPSLAPLPIYDELKRALSREP